MFADFIRKFLKKRLKLALFLNTWNYTVIARKGDQFSENLLKKASESGKSYELSFTRVGDTFVAEDFKKLLKKDSTKYAFITDNLKFLDDLADYLGEVRLPDTVLVELGWMKEYYIYTYHHVIAVTALVIRMARDLTFSKEEIVKTAELALLYDIGITRVPLEIVNKQGELTNHDRDVIHLHPVYSALLIAHYYQNEHFPHLDAILHHHEALDGSGEPQGIRNDDLISNMICVADTFDALISARPFRKHYSTKEAFKICEELMTKGKIIPEILPLIYSYFLFINKATGKVTGSKNYSPT
ncbi:MAG: HD domain-containing protein [Spirochaetales bacterium]|nr:HD domain-containing protein [Spirochaetales bacterium]